MLRALLFSYALLGCSVGTEHPPMLGDCVRCAVVPGVGGSTPAMPNVDSGNGMMQDEGGTNDEGGTFGDGGGTSDGPTDGPLFDTGGSVFDGAVF